VIPFPSLRRGLIAAAAAVALCGAASVQAQVTLRTVPHTDLKILDPVWTTADITRDHSFMIYDTLFGMDEQGKFQPQMVDKYTTSADNKVWTFTLRPGLKFHDGAPVTAQDVIASIQRWGKRDVLGQKLLESLDSMTAEGSNGFRMTFKQPFGVVLDALGKPSPNVLFIMPRKVAETPADQQIDSFIGSGPFTLRKEDFRPGDRVVYRKNADYVPRKEPASGLAGGKVVKVDQVEWVFLRDPQTQANALLNGEVDILEVVPAARAAELEASGKVKLVTLKPSGQFVVHFNHKLPPFDNPKLVRAAMLAVNQEAVLRAQVVNRDFYKPCASVYLCSSIYGGSPTGFFTGKPQFEEAKKLVKEGGYDGKPVVVMMPSDVPAISKLPMVYSELLKQVGFNVDLQQMDWATLTARRAKKDPVDKGGWNVFATHWSGVTASSPMTHTALTGNGDAGYFGWPTDAELEALKLRFVQTSDAAERKNLAAQIQTRALEVGVFAPLGEVRGRSGAGQGITGQLPSAAMLYWNVEKK